MNLISALSRNALRSIKSCGTLWPALASATSSTTATTSTPTAAKIRTWAWPTTASRTATGASAWTTARSAWSSGGCGSKRSGCSSSGWVCACVESGTSRTAAKATAEASVISSGVGALSNGAAQEKGVGRRSLAK